MRWDNDFWQGVDRDSKNWLLETASRLGVSVDNLVGVINKKQDLGLLPKAITELKELPLDELFFRLTKPEVLEEELHKSYYYIITHNGRSCRCGYIQIPESHPWFYKKYTELEDVEVHGGLTFSGHCLPDLELEEESWYLGFDCCHCMDAPDPKLKSLAPSPFFGTGPATIKTQGYVRQECFSLIEQAIAAAEQQKAS